MAAVAAVADLMDGDDNVVRGAILEDRKLVDDLIELQQWIRYTRTSLYRRPKICVRRAKHWRSLLRRLILIPMWLPRHLPSLANSSNAL